MHHLEDGARAHVGCGCDGLRLWLSNTDPARVYRMSCEGHAEAFFLGGEAGNDPHPYFRLHVKRPALQTVPAITVTSRKKMPERTSVHVAEIDKNYSDVMRQVFWASSAN